MIRAAQKNWRKYVKGLYSIVPALFVTTVCLVGCGGMTREQAASAGAECAASGSSVSGGTVTEKSSWDGTENEEQIVVGEEQIALRQGETKDSTLVVRLREGKEEVVATFDIRVKDCHIEPFEGILGYDGFQFFVKEDASVNPYGAEVCYVGLTDEKAKVLFENHAKYEEETGKYTAVFEEIKDFDGDGMREVVSNISYYVDGGQGTIVYDCKEGQVYEGNVLDLFDLRKDEYYVGRATDIGSWYERESGKVMIHYKKDKKSDKVSKSYALDLDKINMEESTTFYVSDELKDLGKYDETDE